MTIFKKGRVKKWKFKMAFALKGRGAPVPLGYFEEKKLFEKNLESLPDCQNAFCTLFELDIMYMTRCMVI